MVSTFSGGDLGPETWRSFREERGGYLLPSFDGSDRTYYSDPHAWFDKWQDAVDGVFSWESAWPIQDGTVANVSAIKDQRVQDVAEARGKAYMIGLSPLQYKHCCGSHWYRAGEVNLPERMTQILDLSPEFVEVMTWNDAGESHYIGNYWSEAASGNILEYADTQRWPHDGWQPLIQSFISAYKMGAATVEMAPSGSVPAGSMWYHGILKTCSSERPSNFEAALDAVNYAVVMPGNWIGITIRVSSDGTVLQTVAAHSGLNYGSVPGMQTGPQKVELLGMDGSMLFAAESKVDVETDMPGFCNLNYYVVGLQ